MKEITDDEDRVTIGVYKRSFNLFLLAVYRLIATNEKTPRQRDQQDWIMELREQSHSLLSGPLGEPMNEAEKQGRLPNDKEDNRFNSGSTRTKLGDMPPSYHKRRTYGKWKTRRNPLPNNGKGSIS